MTTHGRGAAYTGQAPVPAPPHKPGGDSRLQNLAQPTAQSSAQYQVIALAQTDHRQWRPVPLTDLTLKPFEVGWVTEEAL